MPLREQTVSQYSFCSSFTADRIFVMWIDNSFVEQVDDPAMYLSLYGVLWSLWQTRNQSCIVLIKFDFLNVFKAASSFTFHLPQRVNKQLQVTLNVTLCFVNFQEINNIYCINVLNGNTNLSKILFLNDLLFNRSHYY